MLIAGDVACVKDFSEANKKIQKIEAHRELLITLHACELCHSVESKEVHICHACGGYNFSDNIIEIMNGIELTMSDDSPIPIFKER